MAKCFKLNGSVKKQALVVIDCRGLPEPHICLRTKPNKEGHVQINDVYHSLVAAVPNARKHGYISEPVDVPGMIRENEIIQDQLNRGATNHQSEN